MHAEAADNNDVGDRPGFDSLQSRVIRVPKKSGLSTQLSAASAASPTCRFAKPPFGLLGIRRFGGPLKPLNALKPLMNNNWFVAGDDNHDSGQAQDSAAL